MPGTSALTAVLLGAALAVPGPTPLLRLQDPALLESSGLAVSAVHDDVLWTHADGPVAEVRAVDASGETVAVVTLADIDPFDPEALAPGSAADGSPALFLGDIGDNRLVRPDVSVFRFDEPDTLQDQTVPATWYRFTYPDGPHDAEALLVDPRSGRLLVATKGFSDAGLYRAPSDLVTADEGTNRLVRVAGVPALVTDGAYLPDGRFALRTYSTLHLYDRPGQQVAVDQLPGQPQGESLAVDGDRLLVGSEGERSAVYAVEVPRPDTAVDEAPTTADRSPGRSDDAAGWRDAYRIARAVAIVVLLVGVVVFLRRGRRR